MSSDQKSMNTRRPRVNPEPNWRDFPGYVYGLPQASMVAFEAFPSDPVVDELNEALLALVASIVEDDAVPTLSQQGALGVAAALATATARLQNWIYIPTATQHIAFSQSSFEGGMRVQLILPCWNPRAAYAAYSACAELWNRLSAGETIETVTDLRKTLTDRLSPFVSKSVNNFAQVKGIMALGLNLVRLPGGVLCLGTGKHARLMSSTVTDRTSGISLQLARNKFQTAALLRMSGLPGAENKQVQTADEAVAAAKDFGFPVVIKPVDLDRGDGIAADLRTESSVRKAFADARALSELVMVEKHIQGFTHRLTVVEGDVISVRQRIPGGVTGNGTMTVAELVEEHQQSSSSRRWQRSRGRLPVQLDSEALELLEQQQLGTETILPDGQFLRLRRRDNINAGGRNRDIPLDEVHPENIELAIAAARVLRLDIAGIDLISEDIGRPWREVGAGICEINGRPQFAARLTPELHLAMLSRIVGPVAHVPADLVLCADDPKVRAAVVKGIAAREPERIVSTREGLWRQGISLTEPFSTGYAAATAAAIRLDVEAMTCVMSVFELYKMGSPLRSWSNFSVHPSQYSKIEQQLIPMVPKFLGIAPALM